MFDSQILLLEDEANLGVSLSERLHQEGHQVHWSRLIADAELEIGAKSFDLAILDVGLPDGSGFDFAKTLRAKHPGTAILFLTAFSESDDRIRGLELGAEDYVVKPFHSRELMLRIQNILRRARYLRESKTAGTRLEGPVTIGLAQVDFAAFQIETGGATVRLTHKECALLKLLFERRGQAVSRDEILDRVWSSDEYPTARTVDNFVMKLRRLIEKDPESPEIILSVRGVGYQLL